MVRPEATLLTHDAALREAAGAPRWEDARVDALGGDVDAVMLRHWARNLDRRHGPGTARRVRERLGDRATDVPLDPKPGSRLPVPLQLRLVRAIADALHGEDLYPIAGLVREDVRRDIPRAGRLGLRAYGAERALRHVPAAHERLYGVGEASAEVDKGRASIRYEGNALFGQPTWRFIVVATLGVAVENGAGRLPERTGLIDPGPEGFEVTLRW